MVICQRLLRRWRHKHIPWSNGANGLVWRTTMEVKEGTNTTVFGAKFKKLSQRQGIVFCWRFNDSELVPPLGGAIKPGRSIKTRGYRIVVAPAKLWAFWCQHYDAFSRSRPAFSQQRWDLALHHWRVRSRDQRRERHHCVNHGRIPFPSFYSGRLSGSNHPN